MCLAVFFVENRVVGGGDIPDVWGCHLPLDPGQGLAAIGVGTCQHTESMQEKPGNMGHREAKRSSGRATGRLLALTTAFVLAFSMILIGSYHAHVSPADAGTHLLAAQDGQAVPCDKAGQDVPTDEACCMAAAGCGLFASSATEAFSAWPLSSERGIVPVSFLHSAILFMENPPPRSALS